MPKAKTPIKIKDRLQIYGAYDSFSPEDLIARREALLAQLESQGHSKKDVEVTFCVETYSHPYDPSEYPGLFMEWYRPETKEEEILREKANEDSQRKLIEQKRQQLAQLKKELGEG